MRGVDVRRARGRAQARAGRRVQPVRVHQDQRPRRRERRQRGDRPRREAGRSRCPPTRPPTRSTSTARPSSHPTSSSSPANNYAGARGTRFAVVRYGNVVGCRGSVIPFFQTLPRRRRQLPITDPRMTRFWITLAAGRRLRAVHASSRCAAARSSSRRSRRMNVIDLARPSRRLRARVVGIRPGEKLHEVMVTRGRRAAPRVDSRRSVRDPAQRRQPAAARSTWRRARESPRRRASPAAAGSRGIQKGLDARGLQALLAAALAG